MALGPPETTRATKLAAYEGMVRIRGADKARDFFERQGFCVTANGRLVFPDDFEDRQWLEHLAKNGFPAVNALYAQAEAGQGLTGAEAEQGQALAGLMQFVVTDTPLMAEWQRFYAQKPWPSPKLGRRGLYFPAGGPAAIETFARATRHDHAA